MSFRNCLTTFVPDEGCLGQTEYLVVVTVGMFAVCLLDESLKV